MNYRNDSPRIILTIRREQMERMADAHQSLFAERMVGLLHEAWPEEEGIDLPWVYAGIAGAGPHAISSEYDIARFLNLRLILGDRFDNDPGLPWVHDALRHAGLTPRERLDRIYELLPIWLEENGEEEGDAQG